MKSGFLEVISDIDGNFGEDNPCYHYSDSWQIHSGLPFKVEWSGASPGVIIEGTFRFPHGPSTTTSPTSSLLACSTPVNHPDNPSGGEKWYIPPYAAEGWQGVYPVIRAKLALLNSVYELRDFKRLPQLLRNTRKSLDSLGEVSRGYRWRTEAARKHELALMYKLLQGPIHPRAWLALTGLTFKRAKRLSLAEILRALVRSGRVLPEHFLNWKFAVEPLLRDISALSNASSQLSNEVDQLLNRADLDVVNSSHWTKYLEPGDIPGTEIASFETAAQLGGEGPMAHKVINEFVSDPKYTFTARYSYTYPKQVRELAHALALKDRLGLHMSAQNLWNAIPWSFVVDWFVRISPWLEQFTPHHLEPHVVLHGSSHSVKYSYKSSVVGNPWVGYIGTEPYYTWTVVPATYQSRTQECYVRNSVVPFASLPKTSDFSTLERLLAISLGISSVRFNTL